MRLGSSSGQDDSDVAFRAVVRDIERIDAEAIVCLGDIVQSAASPRKPSTSYERSVAPATSLATPAPSCMGFRPTPQRNSERELDEVIAHAQSLELPALA